MSGKAAACAGRVQCLGPGLTCVRSLVICDAEATSGAVAAGQDPVGRRHGRCLVIRH